MENKVGSADLLFSGPRGWRIRRFSCMRPNPHPPDGACGSLSITNLTASARWRDGLGTILEDRPPGPVILKRV